MTPDRQPYDEYIASEEWVVKRNQALSHYGRVCQRCGATKFLQVHHKTYARLFYEEMEDLEILCKKCHKAEHAGETHEAPSAQLHRRIGFRPSLARPRARGIRMSADVERRFEALVSSWHVTYADAFERLVTEAEKRNDRKKSDDS